MCNVLQPMEPLYKGLMYLGHSFCSSSLQYCLGSSTSLPSLDTAYSCPGTYHWRGVGSCLDTSHSSRYEEIKLKQQLMQIRNRNVRNNGMFQTITSRHWSPYSQHLILSSTSSQFVTSSLHLTDSDSAVVPLRRIATRNIEEYIKKVFQ